MSTPQHTQGRLSQGRTLSTRITQRWSKEEWERNEARERCMVFADFTPIDEGRGRRLVAECHQGPEDARRIAACWNVCEGLDTDLLENVTMLGDTLASRFALRDKIERELAAERDELLEALRDAYSHITLLATGQKPPRSNAEASEAAGAAIAKATGGER